MASTPERNAPFWQSLDRLIALHWKNRTEFSRAAGIMPESLNKAFSKMFLPRPETLELMLGVLSTAEQQQLVDSFMFCALGERWNSLFGSALAGAMMDDTFSREEAVLLQLNRASDGSIARLAGNLQSASPEALKAVFNALAPLSSPRR